MYDNDNGDSRKIPWYLLKPDRSGTFMEPAYAPPEVYARPQVVTPWVFGGFRAPIQSSDFAGFGPPDSTIYPSQFRPLNKYVDPTASSDPLDFNARGTDIIQVYKCPGDRSNRVDIIGQASTFVEEDNYPAYDTNGSSYGLNTRWMHGYYGHDYSGAINSAAENHEASSRIARGTVGDAAARFIQWNEIGFYSATHDAAEKVEWGTAAPQRFGWHRKFSFWSVAFADGHAAHGYFDTRQVYGLDGTIWQPNFYLGRPLN
jgi:hypothetical protein